MILVDTSIWVDHLRAGDDGLATALERGLVFTHPFIVGELACGRIRNRGEVLGLLGSLPVGPVATDDEALQYIDFHQLMGRGIGYVDVHLLASTALADGLRLWTRDRRLEEVAAELGMAHTPAK
ncbi:MAG: type II toxin-antitoxin system VapC family toxin [Gemmatimonadetes bacterium]|nr:type II toxin-antitoxin system VapC family toxin [Gemmatimonadota bacterium]